MKKKPLETFLEISASEMGKKGGKKRWAGVPAEERSRLARKAIKARWHPKDTNGK